MSDKPRQVSILLPAEVITKAVKTAAKVTRADGLKQTPTAQLREWLLRGMEQHVSR